MDANLNVSTFSYDRDGNLVALSYPSVPGAPANVERYEYDAAGRLSVKTTPNGAAVRFLYDPAGKVEAMYTGDAVAGADDIPMERLLVRSTYNGAGQVVREENAHTALTNTYDTLGRLSRVNFPDLKRRIDYSYSDDIVDEIKVSDTSKSPAVTVHTFRLDLNAAGEVTRAKQASGIYGTYGYDENGRRISLMAKSGAVQSYRYDTNDRLVELTIKKNDEVLAGFRYTHDGAGNRTGITYADGSRSVYEYDDAYRLLRDLRVDRDGDVLYDETYAYDAVGNRLRKTRTGGRKPVDVSYEYNARNQLVAAIGDEAGEYEYDADGNLVRTVGPHGVEEREYDVLGRLTRYSGPGGTERYTHVAAGWKRHTAEYAPVDGEAEKYTFVYHGDNVLMDLVGDALKHEATYLTPYLDENLLMYLPDVGYFYYGHDGLGSVRTITTNSGYLRNTYDYTAYGEPDPIAHFDGPLPTHQRYGFTGRENNPIAGDMFYRYRNYSFMAGLMTRRDPVNYNANPFGGLYIFLSNNPTNRIDPFGLKDLLCECNKANSDVLDPSSELWDHWRIISGGRACKPPPIECRECTESHLGWYENGKITICVNNAGNENISYTIQTAIRHELIHGAQEICHGWVPQDCRDKICQEIQAYYYQRPVAWDNLREAVRPSMDGECPTTFDVIFTAIENQCINAGYRRPNWPLPQPPIPDLLP